MQNINPQVSELFHKYMVGQLTDAERREFLDYTEDPVFHKEIKEMLSAAFENQTVLADVDDLGRKRLLDIIFGNNQIPAKPKKVKLWPKIGIVAAAVTIVVSASIWLYQENQKNSTEHAAFVNDVLPGKKGATLTLANGKKISLGEAISGELAHEAGAVVIKNIDGQIQYRSEKRIDNLVPQYNTLSTSRGQTYLIILPDQSKVWLNAASSITYPVFFDQNKNGDFVRSVTLKGEGYFEIKKDSARPFIVNTEHQQVEVLGTHFNINSYEDEQKTQTTLIEGSVKIKGFSQQINKIKDRVIVPGEQATLYKQRLSVERVNTTQAIAWKNGEFMFNDESLVSIMRKISRWYDVEIVFEGIDANEKFWGSIPRDKNISVVLYNLELTGEIHFKIKDKTVYVTK